SLAGRRNPIRDHPMAKPVAQKSHSRSKMTSAVPADHTAGARADAASETRNRSGEPKWVYAFGGGKAEGRADMRNLLGGKGAGLAEMASLGLPVPPGFTITTEVCTHYYANGNTYPKELEDQ